MTTLKKLPERRGKAAVATRVCLALLCLFAASQTSAQTVSDKDLAAICAQTTCRPEKQIDLRAPNDNVVRFNSDPVPYVYNGTLTIYPGETYAVRMRVHGKELGAPVFERGSEGKPLPAGTGYRPEIEAKALRETVSAPVEALVYFSFKQGNGTDMELTIVSQIPVTLKYDAIMLVATPNGIQPDRTSSCPVFANAASVERWPVPLTMLALSNFRIVAGTNPACM